DRQQEQAHRAQPQVPHLVLEHYQSQANPAEEEDREHALPQGEKAVIRDDRADAAAKILRRGRIRIHLMAWPVVTVKARQREHEKNPRPDGEEQERLANDVLALHESFLDFGFWIADFGFGERGCSNPKSKITNPKSPSVSCMSKPAAPAPRLVQIIHLDD